MEINVVKTTRTVPFSELHGGDIFRFVARGGNSEPGFWMKTGRYDDYYKGVVVVNLDTGITDVVTFEKGREILVEKAKSTSMTVEF